MSEYLQKKALGAKAEGKLRRAGEQGRTGTRIEHTEELRRLVVICQQVE